MGQADPFYDLDARESDLNTSYPAPDGLINSWWWEIVAEGVTDLRYCRTLERAIESAAKGPDLGLRQKALAAENRLRELREQVKPGLRDNRGITCEQLEEMRQQVIYAILSLSR